MEDFRSRPYADDRMQIEPYNSRRPPPPSHDLRSYSTSHASSYSHKEVKLKKSNSVSDWLKDPELQRKKRVAGYKVYSVEGKVKGSVRKSFRWLKDRYTQVVYGWW
ncbi:hypothetical protein AXF42_Ash009473 [Apostasia shenzhenica]|uniref:DUF3511 domain-containing protein n=1 Tax=Apostasia shenzhenica TaxID=1088818 RepID=A0A2I0B8Y7_9ASPA|nr:hypothetical protein AXF42_Ash009473 [Apostasia shenzhenica]